MRRTRVEPVWLDYAEAAEDPKLLGSLSGAAAAGNFLWTVSDERRTVECLARDGTGYRLHRRLSLDTIFPGLPGRYKGAEGDLESLDIAGGQLWISGSHCHVRREPKKAKGAVSTGRTLDARIRRRPSRRLLGSARLAESGGALVVPGRAFPFAGEGSLRHHLIGNPLIAPFASLPGKENGIDVEGIAVFRNRLLVGLRGPVVDNIAIVSEIATTRGSGIKTPGSVTHFLDLQGLGVRDLTGWKGAVMILAGPVSKTNGPFRLYRWQPRRADHSQQPDVVFEWDAPDESPEAICPLVRSGSPGMLVLCDSPQGNRIQGSRYRADWIAATSLR